MPPPAKKRKTTAGAIATGTRRSTRSQKPLLSIEMIGKVGSFANYDNGDLMNICKAVGPKDAGIVRYTCLKNNDEYLWRITTKNASAGSSGSLEKMGEELSAWMEINTDWRVACKEEWTNDDWNCQARYQEDGEDIVNISPKLLFNNPAVAIELGRVDVLKYLVEDIGIDINSYRCNCYTSTRKFHLLFLAANKKDKACFDYLISRTDADATVSIIEDDHLPVWQYAFATNMEGMGEVFRALISHRSFDPNKPLGSIELLPLHFASTTTVKLSHGSPHDTAKILMKFQILLDAGADPRNSPHQGMSPLEHARRLLVIVGEETEMGKSCKRLIAMMEEKVAAAM